jgi:sugar transferase (PEP-CTERM/EpsH1 system associated)
MEVGVIKLANGLNPAFVTTSICSFGQVGPIRERLNPGVRLFEFSSEFGNSPRLLAQLYTLFRRERPDIVHTHAWGTLCEGYVAARTARVPRIVHGEHGTMETRPRNVRVQRWVWNRLDRVLSVSERLADRMAKEVDFPRERIETIRNGVDLRGWSAGNRDAARADLGVDPADILVLTVGRLVPVKNHAMLVEAIARTRQAGLRCRLAIAGDGPLHGALAAQVEALGLGGAVALLGARHDLPDVLAAADIFALSSDSEGMSNTIIEAMAAGRPVVATDVGGNSELVIADETGLLVTAGDAESMANGLRTLAADPARREAMGAEGKQRAEREFSLERMLEEYQHMYRDVAASRRS